EDAALRAGKINPLIRGVDAVQRPHFPRPVRDLLEQLSIGAVVIEVLVAAGLAEPEKRSVFEPHRIAVRLDPRLGRLAEELLRRAAAGVRGTEVEPRLLAVLNLIDEAMVGTPRHPDNEKVAGAVRL